NGGEIRQAAAPVDIYRRPADSSVADFIGSTNLIPFTADGKGEASIFGSSVAGFMLGTTRSGTISVRPEDVQIVPPAASSLAGKVTFVRDLGGSVETFIEAGGQQIVAVSAPRSRPDVTVGQTV